MNGLRMLALLSGCCLVHGLNPFLLQPVQTVLDLPVATTTVERQRVALVGHSWKSVTADDLR